MSSRSSSQVTNDVEQSMISSSPTPQSPSDNQSSIDKKRSRSFYEDKRIDVQNTDEFADSDEDNDDDKHPKRMLSTNTPKRMKTTHLSKNSASNLSNTNDQESDIKDDVDDDDDDEGDNGHVRKQYQQHDNQKIEDQQQQQQQEEEGESHKKSTKSPSDPGNPKPSKVLFFRNLPDMCSEEELEKAINCHPKPSCVILRISRQAFVRFESIEQASEYMEKEGKQIKVRDRTVYMSFSERQEIDKPTPKQQKEVPNFILLATVMENTPNHLITTDIFHHIFSRYGNVQKIVTFMNKSHHTQGLIQFSETASASTAKAALNGQYIYKGCCKLQIQYSNLTNLNVHRNDDRTKDYTIQLPPANYPIAPPPPIDPYYYQSSGPGYYPPYHDEYGPYSSPRGPRTSVVLVSNLSSNITCDHLFTLLGFYGNVVKVKKLPNNPGLALVQFMNPMGAENAIEFLRGVPLYGSKINVVRSKHDNINPSKEDSDSSGFKSYEKSPLHRYKRNNNIAPKYICPPSQTLHVSSIAEGMTEEDLSQIFKKYGNVEYLKLIEDNERRMAFVRFSMLESAVTALVELHNVGPNPIRISFSKSRK